MYVWLIYRMIRNFMVYILPFILDHFLYCCQKCLTCHIINTESLCNATDHHAVYVVPLVSKQRKHQHGHTITDALIDAVGSSMSDEEFSFGMG